MGCLSSPQTAFSALWAPTFLHKTYQLSPESSAYLTSLISIGGLFGGIALGYLSDCTKKTPLLLMLCGYIAAFCMFLILQGQLSYFGLAFVLLAVGFITNASVIVLLIWDNIFRDPPEQRSKRQQICLIWEAALFFK
ncbi:hypothetical protein BGC07_00490 [Piscirickettsia litoralis]|uniref:Major facilitator superfamily (MFS) profile domain-containing protein n=1 Tax=Piscirickettsia litoralis TaxID=1891921 RepID=A0ABX3A2R3_9GAMM|nr:hypothetical protein BGC07_00490 [Piscirickettsia litoralis]